MAEPRHPDIERARASALEARADLAATMARIQRRLKPAALMKEGWEELREQGGALADGALATARKRPMATAALIGGTILFLARKPLLRMIAERIWPAKETAAPHDSSAQDGSTRTSGTRPRTARRRASEETKT